MTGFEQFGAIVIGAVSATFAAIAWAQAWSSRGGNTDAESGSRRIDV